MSSSRSIRTGYSIKKYKKNVNKDMSIDYDSVFDTNLSVDEYTEKLDEMLKKNRVGIVERRKIIRQKVQEFKDAKRVRDVRER